jgi:two-component system, NarL family, sensor histidine kinase DegS
MKKTLHWSEWSIASKILVLFLGLSIISMGIIGYVTNVKIRDLGNYAIKSSSSLGQRAITDSTNHLNQLGEAIIRQKSQDVARQVEMYLAVHPGMSIEDMRNDQELRKIVVQPVGKTGYTTLIDPSKAVIIIHKFPGQEKNLDSLREVIPSFWALLKSSVGVNSTAGYYDWVEVDGSVKQKYAGIEFINYNNGMFLTLWATTYINEFSLPAEQTREEIANGIQENSAHINKNVSDTLSLFFVIFMILVALVIGLTLLLSRVITSPVKALKKGVEAIGRGNLDYKVNVKTRDELGELAESFNDMAADLKTYTEKMKNTAAENLDKERTIQENLRIYLKKIGQAQEAERKRIARELHDDTIQSLVVVSRKLADLSSGSSAYSAADIREEVRKIIEGVRHFSQELRPSILDDLGLVPAVQWLASNLQNSENTEIEIEVYGSKRQIPQDSELMLFRIIQEALNNIGKHARATKVLIKLEYSSNQIKVTIQDNGEGFEMPHKVSDFARSDKFGLIGIRERIQLLGGSLKIETQKGKGTTIIIEVPA